MRHRRMETRTTGRQGARTIAAAAWAAAMSLAVAALGSSPARAQAFLEPGTTVLNTLVAEAPGDNFGWAAEAIGDLDGDGAAEYVITAILNAAGGIRAGRAYVYDGRTGSLIRTFTGRPNERLGLGVSAGGDANADGVPDYLLGAPGVGFNPARVLVISGADHSVLHEIPGAPVTFLGFDVAFVDDVDGDGRDDVVAGAPVAAVGGMPQAGRVHVFSGATGAPIWTADGTQPFGILGTGVTGLPDVTGDGIPDVAAGAAGEVHDPARTKLGGGQAYVLSGADGSVVRLIEPMGTASAFGFFFVHDAGDVDADGTHDVLIGDFADTQGQCTRGRAVVHSGASGEKLRNVAGENCGDGMGIARGAGDVDGDGHDDLLLGAFTNSEGNFRAGKCYLVSGRNGSFIRTFTATGNNTQVGFDVVRLGDVSGDGLPDWLLTGLDIAYVVAGSPVSQGSTSGEPSFDTTSVTEENSAPPRTLRDRLLPDAGNLTSPDLRYW